MNKKLIYIIITIVTIVFAYLILRNPIVRDLVNILFISFIIAYSLRPLQNKLIERGMKRKLSALILLLGLIGLVSIFFMFLIPSLIKETMNISSTIIELENLIEKWYTKFETFFNNRYLKTLKDISIVKLSLLANSFLNNTFDNILKQGSNLFSIAVVPIIIYYILADGEELSKLFMLLVPVRSRSVLRSMAKNINSILSKYIISQFLLSLLISALTFIILAILGVRNPLLLSITNGIFNIIPYFGPLFGAIPAVIFALIQSPKVAIWTAISLNIIQQIEGDVISPKITGDSVDIHPLGIILLLVVGGKIGGFVGMVIAVPIAVAIKVIIQDLDYYMY